MLEQSNQNEQIPGCCIENDLSKEGDGLLVFSGVVLQNY